MNLNEMIEAEIKNGYDDTNARAKVCQDIILKAIASGPLSRNVIIKGGVVMRSKTGNIRRATQDLDLDFIRYSLADASIDLFIQKLNCFGDITIHRVGSIEELKQEDYHGKRVYVEISDERGNRIISKLDLGVHKHLNIEQEEYCFDMSFDEEGASLLINSGEQVFTEKLRSLLRFGVVSTRYKDIFDMYYLCHKVDPKKLKACFQSYIYGDPKMRETDIKEIIRRVSFVFRDRLYLRRLQTSDKNWLDEDLDTIMDGVITFLESLK